MSGKTEEQKPVWIKCRARATCEGNTAVIVYARQSVSTSNSGGFEPNSGGKSVRYRCLTCKGTFHINS